MESGTEKQLFEYLVAIGFPPSSIIYEPIFGPTGTGKEYRPDFALVDPATKEPLAVIEIKRENDPSAVSKALKQIREYLAALRDRTVRGYVATPTESGGGFCFYTLGDDKNPRQVPSSSFLRFESLSTARSAEKKEMLVDEKKETTDEFRAVCFRAAAAAVLIAVIDFVCSRYGVSLLTTERMALVGAALALVVVPYVQKFKALGIEIDRTSRQVNSR